VSSNASTPGSGKRVALDTSIAIDVLADQADDLLSPDIAEHLPPVPAIGELRYGALNSRKATENIAKVEGLVARCQILNVTAGTAEVYARLRLDLKQKGTPIPENDLWIAALCVEHQDRRRAGTDARRRRRRFNATHSTDGRRLTIAAVTTRDYNHAGYVAMEMGVPARRARRHLVSARPWLTPTLEPTERE
jgi:tRNA(fMet)-specific endonuclease VapC